ncbi:MAG: VWA domain-containing protein [Acidobacteriota bacterium]
MRLPAIALLLTLAPAMCAAQGATPVAAEQSVLRSQTTVVLVPALVRTQSGAIVYTLSADDFRLTDDGVPEKLTLEHDSGSEPLALVVVVEVGGAGARQFQKYPRIAPPLGPMLAAVVGNVPHKIAVLTFDSRPRIAEPFTANLNEAAAALERLQPGCTRQEHKENCQGPRPRHDKRLGDNGAAILDALQAAVDMLRNQPAPYRRAILLVSETLDRGSHTSIEQAVRSITDTDTTIYSIAYSTARSEAAHYAASQLPTQPGRTTRENPRPNPPHGCMGKDPDPDPDGPRSRWAQAYDCLAQLVPPLTLAKAAAIATVDGLRANVPETVARLTGGEYFKLGNERAFELDLLAIGNHLPNRYALSFQPQAPHPGLHQIDLQLPGYEGLEITARKSYWAEGALP